MISRKENDVLRNHLLYMLIFALLTSLFFALYWRDNFREMRRLFIKIFAYMVIGGILTAWLMYLFPIR